MTACIPIIRRRLWKSLIILSGLFGGSLLVGCWMGWLGLFGRPVAIALAGSGVATIASSLLAYLFDLYRWIRCAHRRLRIRNALLRVAAMLATILFGTYLCSVRFAPSENLMGNHDPGMYLAAAAHLSQTGEFRIALPALETLEPVEKDLLLRESAVQFMRGSDAKGPVPWSYYLGLPLADQSDRAGPAIPHFPGGFAIILASGFLLGGWPVAQWIPSVAMLGGVLALAAFVRRHFGVLPALLFVPLACAHPLLSWFANRHFAESALFLFGTLSLVTVTELPRLPRLAGTVAVILLFAGLTVKIDAVLWFGAAASACLFVPPAPRAWKTMACAGVALAPPVLGYLWIQSGFYMAGNLRALSSEPAFAAVALGGIAILAFAATCRRRGKLHSKSRKHFWRGGLLTAGLVLLVFYFFRTDPSQPDTYFEPAAQATIRSFREDTLARIDWYWAPMLFVPALLGGIVASWKRFSFPVVMFGAAGLGSLVLLGYDIRCDPIQPLCMRRMIPAAIPFLLVGACCFASFRRVQLTLIATALTFPLFLASEVDAYRRLKFTPDYEGAFDFLTHIAAALPPESITLVSARSPLSAYAVPLRAIWGRSTWVVRVDKSSEADLAALRSMIEKWQALGYRVCLLRQSRQDELFRGLTTFPLARETLSTSFQAGSYETVSEDPRRFRLPCFVGEFRPAANAAAWNP